MWICLALWKTSRKGKWNILGIALTTFWRLLTLKISENMALKFGGQSSTFSQDSKPTSVNIKELVPLDFLPEQKFVQGRYERMPGFILFSMFLCDVRGPHTHNNDAREEFNVDDKYVTTPDALATASFHILCQKIVFLVKSQIYWNDSASFVDFIREFVTNLLSFLTRCLENSEFGWCS